MDIEEVAEQTPEKLIRHHVDALKGLSREEAIQIATDGKADADVIEGVADALVALYEVWLEEDAMLAEINPLIVTPEREVKALDAKVSLDDNALYRHPENQELPDKRERRSDRAPREGAGRAVRQARRRHRHPRQRRRPGDVDARRRRAGGRQAGELPRRRRRLGRREDQAGGRADPRQRRRQGGAVQHLRRDHPLRRGRDGPDRRVRRDQTDGAVRGAPGRHERRRRAASCSQEAALPNVHAATDDERGGREGRRAAAGKRGRGQS